MIGRRQRAPIVEPEPDYLLAIATEGDALARAAEARPSGRVACYPSWSVLDLVAHTGSVHRWVESLVLSRASQSTARAPYDDREAGPLVDWFRDGVARLGRTLATTDPSVPVWTMAADQSAGFWRRRMAHETATHRWDAEDAVGSAAPIERMLATTGIAETLEIHVARLLAGAAVHGRGKRIRLGCTDTTGEWVVTIGADHVVVETGSGPADAEIVGPASAIWLDLMGRPDTATEVRGDPWAVVAYRRALVLAERPTF